LVHIIDREADSIGHIRQWEDENMKWLTRSRSTSTVEYQGESMRCSLVADQLEFIKNRQVDYKGKKCWQWIAETPIRIVRKAKPSQKKKKKPSVNGCPVDAKLVVCQIMDKKNNILSTWLLITNVQDEKAETIALWASLLRRDKLVGHGRDVEYKKSSHTKGIGISSVSL